MVQKNWKKQNAREKKQKAREEKKKVQRKFGKQKKNTMHRRRATRQTRQRHGGKAPKPMPGLPGWLARARRRLRACKTAGHRSMGVKLFTPIELCPMSCTHVILGSKAGDGACEGIKAQSAESLNRHQNPMKNLKSEIYMGCLVTMKNYH